MLSSSVFENSTRSNNGASDSILHGRPHASRREEGVQHRSPLGSRIGWRCTPRSRPWNRGLKETEIDFVVIVPDTGILCIEVKSHECIAFDGEQWHPPEIKALALQASV
jgi:hypothetical protein